MYSTNMFTTCNPVDKNLMKNLPYKAVTQTTHTDLQVV